MKKILILISCCFLFACNKNSTPTPSSPKQLQIVVSNITTTLTIYNFSVIDQSSVALINVYAQTENKAYTVNVSSGEALKLNYFLELEGPSPATDPVISFICDGAVLASVTNHAGIISGTKYVTIP